MADLQRAAPKFVSGVFYELIQTLEVAEKTELLDDTNMLLQELDVELLNCFKLLQDEYKKRFPELSSVSLSPVDYANTVLKLGKTEDISKVDLRGVLSQRIVIILSTTTATTCGIPLSDNEYQTCLDYANCILALDGLKEKMLIFIKSQMSKIAPNVTTIIGSSLASQLIAAAGGIRQLSMIPSGNIQVIGSEKKELAGMSIASVGLHAGIISRCDLVENTAPEWRKQAQRLVAGKVTLAARVDASSQRTDEIGQQYRLEIIKKLEKLAEAAPGKLDKPIPPPLMESKKRRGGKRARRQKELVALTQTRKLQNRLAFGQAENEVMVGSSVVGMGMLSSGASSQIRLPPVDNKSREAAKKHANKSLTGFFSKSTGLSAVTNPIGQVNPLTKQSSECSKYFGNSTAFKKR